MRELESGFNVATMIRAAGCEAERRPPAIAPTPAAAHWPGQ